MDYDGTANSEPLYQQIYEQLLRQISSGTLKPGDKIPSEKELCSTFNVSRITSKKALEMLSEQRLIARWRGKGSFVVGNVLPVEPARNNATFRTIAFLLSAFNDAFGTRLVCGIEDACDALGYHLILKRTRESPEAEEKALRELDDERVAGILMMPVHSEYYNAEILRQILNKRPLVFVDRKMQGLPVPSVSTDSVAATETAVRHLFSRGHRNIAFYSGPVTHTSTLEDRRRGFSKAFAECGVPLNRSHICSDLLSLDDMGMIIRHLSEHPEISAALTAEFEIALLLKSALSALGRRFPDDFSLITFDHPDYTAESPVFTHLRQDEAAIGKLAVETLDRIIRGEAAPPIDDILIPAELVGGGSVTDK